MRWFFRLSDFHFLTFSPWRRKMTRKEGTRGSENMGWFIWGSSAETVLVRWGCRGGIKMQQQNLVFHFFFFKFVQNYPLVQHSLFWGRRNLFHFGPIFKYFDILIHFCVLCEESGKRGNRCESTRGNKNSLRGNNWGWTLRTLSRTLLHRNPNYNKLGN